MSTPLNDRDHELLSAFLDGELSSAELASLESRLKVDAELRRQLDGLRATVMLVSTLNELKAPRDFRITEKMLRARQRPAIPLFSALSAAAAFILIAVGVIGLAGRPLSTGEQPANVASVPTQTVTLQLNSPGLEMPIAQASEAPIDLPETSQADVFRFEGQVTEAVELQQDTVETLDLAQQPEMLTTAAGIIEEAVGNVADALAYSSDQETQTLTGAADASDTAAGMMEASGGAPILQMQAEGTPSLETMMAAGAAESATSLQSAAPIPAQGPQIAAQPTMGALSTQAPNATATASATSTPTPTATVTAIEMATSTPTATAEPTPMPAPAAASTASTDVLPIAAIGAGLVLAVIAIVTFARRWSH